MARCRGDVTTGAGESATEPVARFGRCADRCSRSPQSRVSKFPRRRSLERTRAEAAYRIPSWSVTLGGCPRGQWPRPPLDRRRLADRTPDVRPGVGASACRGARSRSVHPEHRRPGTRTTGAPNARRRTCVRNAPGGRRARRARARRARRTRRARRARRSSSCPSDGSRGCVPL